MDWVQLLSTGVVASVVTFALTTWRDGLTRKQIDAREDQLRQEAFAREDRLRFLQDKREAYVRFLSAYAKARTIHSDNSDLLAALSRVSESLDNGGADVASELRARGLPPVGFMEKQVELLNGRLDTVSDEYVSSLMAIHLSGPQAVVDAATAMRFTDSPDEHKRKRGAFIRACSQELGG